MEKGRFGVHGGQYIPEILMNAVLELEAAYEHYNLKSRSFISRSGSLLPLLHKSSFVFL